MSPDTTSATLPRSPLAEKRGKAGPPRGHMAYISHYFPALTQTFVYREVLVPEVKRSGAARIHAHFGMGHTTVAMAVAQYLEIPFSMTIHARDLFVDTALLPAKLDKAEFVVTISEYNRRILRGMARDSRA